MLVLTLREHIQYSSALFLKALNICSSLYIPNQVSYPYKISGKITVFCTLISMALVAKGET
jgi:hypothetical protein